MHFYGSIYIIMASVTDHHHRTSKQHEGLKKSRFWCELKNYKSFWNFEKARTTLKFFPLVWVAHEYINVNMQKKSARQFMQNLTEAVTKCTIKNRLGKNIWNFKKCENQKTKR